MKFFKRMWVNQPSTLQPLHALHGLNVLARREEDGQLLMYFLSGEVICQHGSSLVLSEGWQTAREQPNPPAPGNSLDAQGPLHRMWINQPSIEDPLNALHGTNVLAQHEYDDTWCIYFLTGETINQQALVSWLGDGWLSRKQTAS